MDLFLNLNIIISFNTLEENILFSKNVLNWILKQNLNKIWIISNEEKIGNELNEEIFDIKIEYVKKILNIKTKKNVDWIYCPYKQKDIILIDNIIKENKLKRENCLFLINSSEQEYDASGYHIKYKYINK